MHVTSKSKSLTEVENMAENMCHDPFTLHQLLIHLYSPFIVDQGQQCWYNGGTNKIAREWTDCL